MTNQKRENLILVICLIVIIIVSLFFEDFLYERKQQARLIKLFGNFCWYLIVFIVGFLGWYKHKIRWAKKIWQLSYVLFLAILLLLGAIDYLIGGFGSNLKEGIGYVRFFFTGPMPFIILWFFVYLFSKGLIKN